MLFGKIPPVYALGVFDFSIPEKDFILMTFSMNFVNGYVSSHMGMHQSMNSVTQRGNPQEWVSYQPMKRL